MNRTRILVSTLLLGLSVAACGEPRSPRGDFILIVAHTPPTSPSPHFDRLAESGLVFEGDLLGQNEPGATTTEILAEVLTGKRLGQEGGVLYETPPVLPMSARLAGYRVLGSTNDAAVIDDLGLADSFDYGLFGGEREGEEPGQTIAQSISEGAAEALATLTADYKVLGVTRAPILFFGDLTHAAEPHALENLLTALASELLVGVTGGESTPTTVVILFLGQGSPTRAILAGRDIQARHTTDGVDPRDVFPTIARRAGIPATALLRGVNVPSYLAGRNLLDGE